jgi:thioredoxin reductase (NADPH)
MRTKLAIVGTGPAGYTASIYASRYKIKNMLIGAAMGGQASESHAVCNFPSYPEVSGFELMQKFQSHAKQLGAEELIDTVTEIEGELGNFTLHTKTRKEIQAEAILIAIGNKRRKLGLVREKEFLGKGLSYCATCDAMFYQDKTVAVVGGSDAANTASIYLSDIAKKVYQIYRGDELRGEPTWKEEVLAKDNIEVVYDTNVIGLEGEDKLEGLSLDNPYKDKKVLLVNGVFIEIGFEPDTSLSKQLGLNTDESGLIKVNKKQETNVPGVFAAGDITTASNKFRQIITACGEAAVAAESIYWTIKEHNKKN